MDTKEIFAERDAINRQLTEALSKYGNLEPAHLIGRPYNAGAKSKYTFGAGNYLRLAAIQQAQRFDDPRWLPESFMKKRGLKPAEDAHPVKVEYWENKDGKVHGEERLFYNVAEVPGYTKELLVRKGNEPTDFEYARDLLKVSGIKVHDHATSKEIFDAAKEYAIQNGCNGFAAPIAAQMVLKASFLDMDYTKNRLFNEEQIEKMEKEPKILFHAAQQAQKVLNKLLYAQELEMQKGKEQARIALEARKTLQQQRQNQRSGCSCQERFAAAVIVCIHSCRALFSLTSTMKPWSSSRLWTENRFRPVRPRIPPFADGRLRSGTLLRILRRCFMPPITRSAPCLVNPSWTVS